MAKLHIQEYTDLSSDARGNRIPVAEEPAIASQAVTYTTSTASSAFNSATRFVRVIADADAYLVFGSSPTATANDLYLPADTAEYFGLSVEDIQVAAYDGTS